MVSAAGSPAGIRSSDNCQAVAGTECENAQAQGMLSTRSCMTPAVSEAVLCMLMLTELSLLQSSLIESPWIYATDRFRKHQAARLFKCPHKF